MILPKWKAQVSAQVRLDFLHIFLEMLTAAGLGLAGTTRENASCPAESPDEWVNMVILFFARVAEGIVELFIHRACDCLQQPVPSAYMSHFVAISLGNPMVLPLATSA